MLACERRILFNWGNVPWFHSIEVILYLQANSFSTEGDNKFMNCDISNLSNRLLKPAMHNSSQAGVKCCRRVLIFILFIIIFLLLLLLLLLIIIIIIIINIIVITSSSLLSLFIHGYKGKKIQHLLLWIQVQHL